MGAISEILVVIPSAWSASCFASCDRAMTKQCSRGCSPSAPPSAKVQLQTRSNRSWIQLLFCDLWKSSLKGVVEEFEMKITHQTKDTLCEKRGRKPCNLTNCRLCLSTKQSTFLFQPAQTWRVALSDSGLNPCRTKAQEFPCTPSANLSSLRLRTGWQGMSWRKPVKREKFFRLNKASHD